MCREEYRERAVRVAVVAMLALLEVRGERTDETAGALLSCRPLSLLTCQLARFGEAAAAGAVAVARETLTADRDRAAVLAVVVLATTPGAEKKAATELAAAAPV